MTAIGIDGIPKVSVITVCFNSSGTIADTIISVNNQTHPNVEHVFIDGKSSDSTIEIIQQTSSREKKVVSEPDDGIYDAMNKGVATCSGDIVCFLNSDDSFSDDTVLASVVDEYERTKSSFLYGDIRLIDGADELVRDWRVGRKSFRPQILQPQIPHPGMFVNASKLRSLNGPFDSSMRISADLKVQLQLVKDSETPPVYLNRVVVNMRIGGASTGSLSGQYRGWIESARGWRDVHGIGGIFFVFQKVIRKLVQVR